MALQKFVILRCFAKQSLEGRMASVRRMALLLIGLLAVAGCAAQRSNTENDRPPTFYGGVSGGLTR